MKRILVLLLLLSATSVWAGEKEELQWKVRALQSEMQMFQIQYQERVEEVKKAQDRLKAIQDQEAKEKAKPAEKK